LAGQYKNMMRELILQSEINNKLLNNVNNYCSENTEDQTGIRAAHLNMVREKYENEEAQPIYDYFDGTQLINSLFSTIVVPFEFLNGKYFLQENYDWGSMEDLLYDSNRTEYYNCLKVLNKINNEGRLQNSYSKKIKVFDSAKHIRDALCHSGNGQLHFFPADQAGILGQDITHLYFYDNNGSRNKIATKCFLLKIAIQNELIPFVRAFDNIILSIVDASTYVPHSMDDIFREVERIKPQR